MTDIGKFNAEKREAWLEKALGNIPEGSRILDAGAGELKYKKYCPHLEYVSQDFAQYMGGGDGSGMQEESWDQTKLDIISDITTIPCDDSSFDAIMCVEVFEHIPDPHSATREFSRILRPGGVLILTAPFCSLTHMAPYHFFTGFTRYFYEKVLGDEGFEIYEIVPNGDYFEYLAQELRRLPWVIDRYANYSNLPLSIHKFTLKTLSFFYRKLVLPSALFILGWFKSLEAGSNELGNFGYHVIAIKK